MPFGGHKAIHYRSQGTTKVVAECGYRAGVSGTPLGVCKLRVHPLQGTCWGEHSLPLTMLAPQILISSTPCGPAPMTTFLFGAGQNLSGLTDPALLAFSWNTGPAFLGNICKK